VLLVYGGAGSGKSYSVADKIILQIITNENKSLRIMVFRKTLQSCTQTCLALIEERLNEFGIRYTVNRSSNILFCCKSMIYFKSINNFHEIDKIKSFKIDFIWVEEGNELIEPAIDQLDLRMRGKELSFNQMIISFNPISVTNYLYDKFFIRKEECTKFKYNVETNKWINKEYVKKLDSLEFSNKNLWEVYRMGEWGSLEGVIYPDYTVLNIFPEEMKGDKIFGLDFGFNAPTALVEMNINEKDVHVQQRLYQTHLTNSELIDIIKPIVNKSIVYCDSAEPDRIKEMKQAGIYAQSSDKSVLDGIDFVKNFNLKIHSESVDLLKEVQSYSWAIDRDTGKPIDKPVSYNDHLLDGVRYGLYTHLKDHFEFVRIGRDGIIKENKSDTNFLSGLNKHINEKRLLRAFNR